MLKMTKKPFQWPVFCKRQSYVTLICNHKVHNIVGLYMLLPRLLRAEQSFSTFLSPYRRFEKNEALCTSWNFEQFLVIEVMWKVYPKAKTCLKYDVFLTYMYKYDHINFIILYEDISDNQY